MNTPELLPKMGNRTALRNSRVEEENRNHYHVINNRNIPIIVTWNLFDENPSLRGSEWLNLRLCILKNKNNLSHKLREVFAKICE